MQEATRFEPENACAARQQQGHGGQLASLVEDRFRTAGRTAVRTANPPATHAQDGILMANSRDRPSSYRRTATTNSRSVVFRPTPGPISMSWKPAADRR